MRQSILTDDHRGPPRPPPPRRNNLVPSAVRNPVVIAPKVEEQLGQRFLSTRDTPDIIRPFISRDGLHFGSPEVSYFVSTE